MYTLQPEIPAKSHILPAIIIIGQIHFQYMHPRYKQPAVP